MDDKTVSKVLLDVQKEYAKSNKIKDKIIMLLIVLMFAEAVVGYSGFVYYESQFETEGENANAEYNDNDVSGNQYNGNAVHNEKK